MKFNEAFVELMSGKKIRRDFWYEDTYWVLIEGQVFNHNPHRHLPGLLPGREDTPLTDWLTRCGNDTALRADGEWVIVEDKPETHSFSWAIEQLKGGQRVARKGWNGKGQYIEIGRSIGYETLDGEKCERVYHNDIGSQAIVFVGTSGRQVGWLASQADMLAEDWVLHEEDD